MNLATWKSNKSLIMQELRKNLKGKTEPGKPTLSKKEANRVWREDILGIRSEEQKKADKAKRQTKNSKPKQYKELDEEQT